jgi:hypothetical protein
MGMVSLYHELNTEVHGSETQSTFYMYRKTEKPFHIDYCFAPVSWVSRIEKFEIGEYSNWKHMSDHLLRPTLNQGNFPALHQVGRAVLSQAAMGESHPRSNLGQIVRTDLHRLRFRI